MPSETWTRASRTIRWSGSSATVTRSSAGRRTARKGGDQREMVYQDKHLDVKRNQVEHIEGNYELMVGNGGADDGGKLDIVVEKKETKSVGADGLELTVEGDCMHKIDGQVSETIGLDHHEKVDDELCAGVGPERAHQGRHECGHRGGDAVDA